MILLGVDNRPPMLDKDLVTAVDSGLAVLVFSPGDDPIACLNKAIAFLLVVASLRVTVQQVQWKQGQSYSGTGYKSNATSSRGNNAITFKVKDIWLGNALPFTKNVELENSVVKLLLENERLCKEINHVKQKSMFNGVHYMCLLDFVKNVNNHAKSAKKHKKQNIWKPMGHVFTKVGLKWKPTGKTFTIVAGKYDYLKSILWRRHRHNLFFVGQFCDADLEVTFRKNTCFVCNLEGVDLLSGSRDTNLYTISLDDMLKTSLICLLSKASKTKSCLWHHRLSHLNFGTLNKLAKDGLARGIPRLKFQKDHLCSACTLGKSKKSSHQPKAKDTNQEKLYLLYMDLCGPMRMASINGKRYILVIVDDYSGFTWVRFLRTKDEAPEAIIKCIKNIQTDVVERQNQNLVEAARTMLIFSKAPLFLWAEAINTACYTHNRSLICLRYNKTPYELMQDKKPDLSFFYVFGSLCYPTNEKDDIGKLDAKADIGIFVGYAPVKKAFKIYNKRTCEIIETIYVTFDELTAIASEQFSLGPGLHSLTPATSSSGLVPNLLSQQPFPVVAAPRAVNLVDLLMSTSIDHDAPSTSNPSKQEQEHSPNISQGFKESPKTPIFCDDTLHESLHEDSSSQGSSLNVRQTHTLFEHLEPMNFKQTMTKPSWIDAMQEEIHEFKRLQVWELVPYPDKVMLIKLRWIYKVKTDEFGRWLHISSDSGNQLHWQWEVVLAVGTV
nr:retrovirus-related Pol polyprotein from transposon TNT 1-94 [Tanacetum cinerariifolium]